MLYGKPGCEPWQRVNRAKRIQSKTLRRTLASIGVNARQYQFTDNAMDQYLEICRLFRIAVQCSANLSYAATNIDQTNSLKLLQYLGVFRRYAGNENN